MRSTVSEDVPAFPYPCLKISKNAKNIILFTDHRTGTIVSSPRDQEELGYHSISWLEEDFLPFSGKVTLSNDA